MDFSDMYKESDWGEEDLGWGSNEEGEFEEYGGGYYDEYSEEESPGVKLPEQEFEATFADVMRTTGGGTTTLVGRKSYVYRSPREKALDEANSLFNNPPFNAFDEKETYLQDLGRIKNFENKNMKILLAAIIFKNEAGTELSKQDFGEFYRKFKDNIKSVDLLRYIRFVENQLN
jgi:hypothetical protein